MAKQSQKWVLSKYVVANQAKKNDIQQKDSAPKREHSLVPRLSPPPVSEPWNEARENTQLGTRGTNPL